MARIKPKVSISDSGMIEDKQTGLLIPSRMVGAGGRGGRWRNRKDMPEVMRGLLTEKGYFDNALIEGFYHGGYAFRRDENTLVPYTDLKGGFQSELMLSALASGSISNVGVSPVPFPQLPAIIRSQQAQAQTAAIDLTGRQTPVRKATDAISRFNDTPLGATQAMADMVYNYRTFNRGSPVALVPVVFDMSVWKEHGMTVVPILEKGQTEETTNMFYLEVDWSRVGTPVPYLADPLDIIPSGLRQWPYWYQARQGKNRFWILLHHTQIIPIVPGDSPQDLIGTSSVWMCLGFLLEEFLIIEERVEKKLASVASGLLGISGTSQNAAELTQDLNNQRELLKEEGRYFASDYAILTSNMRPIKFEFMSLRQSDGVEFQERRQYYEDVLALAMNTSLNSIVLRGGVGYGAQASAQNETVSDSGVNAILSILEVAIGSIYPRLQVSVSRQNDPAQRLNIGALADFANAVKDLNGTTGEASEPILTREEVRTIIDREIIPLPATGAGVVNAGAVADDTSESEASPGGEVEEEGGANESGNDQSNQTNGAETEAQRVDRGVWTHFINTLEFAEDVSQYAQ